MFEGLLKRFESIWTEERATEIAVARDGIITVLKEQGISLPGACFALDLVKHELLRAQLQEFLGNVKLGEDLPLSDKKLSEMQGSDK